MIIYSAIQVNIHFRICSVTKCCVERVGERREAAAKTRKQSGRKGQDVKRQDQKRWNVLPCQLFTSIIPTQSPTLN